MADLKMSILSEILANIDFFATKLKNSKYRNFTQFFALKKGNDVSNMFRKC